MKFSTLFQTSTILLWSQSVSASSDREEHRNVRARATSVESTGNEAVMTKSRATMAITCEDLSLADLNLAEFGNNDTCNDKAIFSHVKSLMTGKNCRTTYGDVKNTIKSLAGKSNYRKAKMVLRHKCKAEGGYSSCSTLEELNFKTIEKCSTSNVNGRVMEVLEGKSCSHSWKEEIKILTGEKNDKEAQKTLRIKCKSIFGCAGDFETNGCDYISVKEVLHEETKKDCPHDADTELMLITGTDSLDAAKAVLEGKCSPILDGIAKSSYTNIDSQFTDDFMKEYIAGKGFLNERTGNVKDMTEGPDQESIEAGQSIHHFFYYDELNAILQEGNWGDSELGSCENQAYVCCFGRDRQFNEENGNCAEENCEDADPLDNSNLCFTEPNLTAYPGEIEGDIHCHGLAWSYDSNDLISKFKVNNFFYVSMYDHMYQRGYVEPAVTGGPNEIPMCGCVEDMPKVTRADCTQVDVDFEVSFSRDVNGELTLNTEETPEVEFNACKGYVYGRNYSTKQDNDLASYAVRLNKEGRMSDETQYKIFETLLGYENPNNNENEAVCQTAYNAIATTTDGDHPCLNIDSNKLEFDGCDLNKVRKIVQRGMSNNCKHSLDKELQLLTGTDNDADATQFINEMCSAAWDDLWELIDTSDFEEDISEDFDDQFMKEYIKGETYLNLRTGNFEGNTKNSDDESVETGEDIRDFFERDVKGASTSKLVATFESEKTNFQNCQHNSIMCCFGRDRQFGDDNGDCGKGDCDDADPADNSNLCYTKPSFTPYPRDAEGDIHCHGLAWADDSSHPSATLKYNNFFYVSVYDHMYRRGYVQTMIYDQPDNSDTVPMCGCIEDMMPVSRADCTEIEFHQKFKLGIGSDGNLSASPVDIDFEIGFIACRGINPGDPSQNKNNDLGSYVYRLVEEGLLEESTRDEIYKVLVGYENPNSNSNEAACRASYEDETGNTYPSN